MIHRQQPQHGPPHDPGNGGHAEAQVTARSRIGTGAQVRGTAEVACGEGGADVGVGGGAGARRAKSRATTCSPTGCATPSASCGAWPGRADARRQSWRISSWPHVPWRLLPSGAQYPVGGPALPGSTDRVWSRDRFLVEQAMRRHLLQVGYADRLLGQLVARLQAAGLWDRALVVVVADHGIGLRPGRSRREITRNDFSAVAAVPLFVKGPGQRKGRIADAPARTIDVMPTIASILGVRDRPRFDGVPLAARQRPSVLNPWLRVRQGRSGQLVSLRFDTFVRARDAELARQRRNFPRGLRSLSRIGPNRWLVGRRVRSLPVSQGPLQVHIDHDNAFAYVDRHSGVVPVYSGVVPVYVTGHFTGHKQGGVPLAVGVNGRIVAVGASYPVRDATRFSMLIPSQSLRRGHNVVEVFAVTAGRLLRLGRAPR